MAKSSERRESKRKSRRAPGGGELDVALALMHFGFRKMIEEPDRLLSLRGFGRVHHRVLFFVARRPGLSVGELLSILDVTKQSLHRPMQELARAGLLDRRSPEENRRIKCLYLTRAGQAFENRLSGIQRELFRRVFRRQGPAAQSGFRAVLSDLGEGRAAVVLNGKSHLSVHRTRNRLRPDARPAKGERSPRTGPSRLRMP
jgi:DNA-binding MarR family transcriptional regulator